MKLLQKSIYVFVLGFGLVFLNACFENDNKSKQSFDEGPTPLDVDVNIETNNEGIPLGVKLRAAPQSSSVSLDWDPVSNAADYRVSRQIEGGDAVLALTGGASSYSFSAQEDSTYSVSVSAIDSTGKVVSMSKVIKVITPASDALKVSDEGL